MRFHRFAAGTTRRRFSPATFHKAPSQNHLDFWHAPPRIVRRGIALRECHVVDSSCCCCCEGGCSCFSTTTTTTTTTTTPKPVPYSYWNHSKPQSLFSLSIRVRNYSSSYIASHKDEPPTATTDPTKEIKQAEEEEEEGDAAVLSEQDATLVMKEVLEGQGFEDSSAAAPLTDIPGTSTTASGRTMAIVFTCRVCQTRSAKKFTAQAYEQGVVIVRCPSCQNLHLIADRLGYFQDESWDVQRALAQMGENVVAVNQDNVLQLTLRDVVGTEAADALQQSSASLSLSLDEKNEATNETTRGVTKKH